MHLYACGSSRALSGAAARPQRLGRSGSTAKPLICMRAAAYPLASVAMRVQRLIRSHHHATARHVAHTAHVLEETHMR